ncbi:MAG: thiamine pyrophosphate-dependent enzyme [Phycisphaerales bacterium]
MTDTPRATPSAKLDDETLIQWLRDMVRIREFETRTQAAYQQAKIGGFCHIYTGQESVVVGTFAAVTPDDPIITAYRDHGHALARGMHPRACMAEMFGMLEGCAKGKGGSMHMFDKPNNLFGGHGIVGAQTPLGAGLAFATRYEWEVLETAVDGSEAKKKVCLCYLGDGALNQGALHEAMNLAGLMDLPVIYIVENNGYSMGTSIGRGTTEADNLGAKAAAYGIDYLETDAADIRGLYDDFKPFADDLRERQRPGFVNLKCYRYQGHSMSDPQKYRSKEEVDKAKSNDCIDNLAKWLMGSEDEGGRGCLSEEDFKELQREAKDAAKDAVDFAESGTRPDPEKELFSDVYFNPVHPHLSPTAKYKPGVVNPLLEEFQE